VGFGEATVVWAANSPSMYVWETTAAFSDKNLPNLSRVLLD